MHKKLVPVYIAAAALLLVGAFYLAGILRSPQVPLPSPSPVASPSASAPTASVAASTPGWKAYQDPQDRFSFQYPESLGTDFIGAQQWPPTLTVATSTLSCVITRSGSPIQRTQKTIGNRTYCITLEIGAAAGTVYTRYIYATGRGANVVSLDFTLRFPQCMNYDGDAREKCLAERNSFDIDAIADRILQTVELR